MKIVTIILFFCSSLALSAQLPQGDFEHLPSEIQNLVLQCFDLQPESWGRLALSHRESKEKVMAVYKKRWTDFIKHLMKLADPKLPKLIDVDSLFENLSDIKSVHERAIVFVETPLTSFERQTGLPLLEWAGLELFTKFSQGSQDHQFATNFRLIDICLWNNYYQEYLQLSDITQCYGHSYTDQVDDDTCFLAASIFSGNPLLTEHLLSTLFSTRFPKSYLTWPLINYIVHYILIMLKVPRSESREVAMATIQKYYGDLPNDQSLKMHNYLKKLLAVLTKHQIIKKIMLSSAYIDLLRTCGIELSE